MLCDGSLPLDMGFVIVAFSFVLTTAIALTSHPLPPQHHVRFGQPIFRPADKLPFPACRDCRSTSDTMSRRLRLYCVAVGLSSTLRTKTAVSGHRIGDCGLDPSYIGRTLEVLPCPASASGVVSIFPRTLDRARRSSQPITLQLT